MSLVVDEPRPHEIFLSLGINIVGDQFKSHLLCADGGVPFSFHVAAPSPILLGYRPDAVMKDREGLIILEIKSYGDLFSAHTAKQLEAALQILAALPSTKLFILVFDVPAAKSIPANIQDILQADKVYSFFVDAEL